MTNKEKLTQCRAILYSYKSGDIISQEHYDFMMSIFEGHSQWEEKKGLGVSSISVQSTEYNSVCFCLNRIDRTSVDISFIHSIKKPKAPK